MIETWFNQDIYKAVKVQYLDGNVFSQDNAGNLIGVLLTRDGVAYSGGGSVSANVIRADGVTVAVSGALSGNAATVVLPQSAYAVPGVISVVIKLTISGAITTIGAIVANVYQSTTDTVVDPGTIIPTIQTLIDEIDTAVASIPPDYSALSNAVVAFNSYGLPFVNSSLPFSSGGFSVTDKGNNVINIYGTPSSRALVNLTYLTSNIPSYLKGHDAILYIDGVNRTTDYAIAFDVYVKTESDTSLHSLINGATATTVVAIPSDVTALLLRADIPASTNSYSDDILVALLNNRYPNQQKDPRYNVVTSADILSETNLNNVKGNNMWLLASTYSYTNKPPEYTLDTGWLNVFDTGSWCLQLFYAFTGGRMWKRRSTNGGWEDWQQISGTGGGGTVINNTYNITTSPTITADTNGWLQSVDTDTPSESGKTDMTGAIMSMLTSTGYCHLGEGIFYVSGSIDMPENSMLCGCGEKTIIRLLQSVSNGYCVKMKEHCTVKDIGFSGSYSDINPTADGGRNAIMFAANYDGETDGNVASQTKHCMISNVWIRNFTGSGILCHNTSINYAKGLYVNNAFIESCYTGINIDYYSEFNKFTNVCIAWCYYACVNNGGNNVFTSCTFHAINTGFYIDGSKPNNAHGIINGCTFAHIGSNTGKAIKLESVSYGFIIADSQFWYNSIDLTSCSGVVFTGCEFGLGTTGNGMNINISGGDTIMFNGCVFFNDITKPPVISITSNDKVKFTGCFGSVSGNAITA